jgi:pilus assembly protein CpaB
MKNIKALGLIFLSLLIGLGAAVYAAGWVTRQGQVALGQVVVAVVDIEPGSRLGPQMLEVVDWPSAVRPSGAFDNAQALQDRVLKAGVLKGEAIVERKLAPPGAQGGLSAVIAHGKRAMTVRVNDVVGVAGFALPGTYVDVMVNTRQEGAGRTDETQISKTVLEQVLVLAVAQEASRDETKPKVVSAVTLELSPQDAERLDLARSVGTLSLVLRNQADRQLAQTPGSTKRQLLGPAQASVVRAEGTLRTAATRVALGPTLVARPIEPAAAAPIPRTCVEVIQNGSRVLNCF